MSDIQKVAFTVNIDSLILGVYTPRKEISPKYIQELAESIDSEGQYKPIIIQLIRGKEKYPVIDGECRVRAMRLLNRKQIKAEAWDVTDGEAAYYAMRLNIMHGRRLEPIEEALHLKKMMDEYGFSQEDLAREFKRSQAWVSQRLSLLENLDEEVKKSVITRVITLTTARELGRLPKKDQKSILEKVKGLSTRKVKAVVDTLKEHPEKKELLMKQPVEALAHIVETPQQLKQVLQQAPEQAVMEVVPCPHCGREMWINWIEHKVWKKQPEELEVEAESN